MIESLSKLTPLRLWWDGGSRSGPENLAVDEALLDTADQPVLRFYDWSGAAVTIGYFQRWNDPPPPADGEASVDSSEKLDITRRWTGGGLVDHRGDRPYSLIVPSGHPLAELPATESYRWIHRRLAQALAAVTALDAVESESPAGRAESHPGTGHDPAQVCFDAPVAWDVIDRSTDRKIAGAAQRRSHRRLLHQGSVMIGATDAELSEESVKRLRQAFADALSEGDADPWSPESSVLERAARLAAERYATAEWRERF